MKITIQQYDKTVTIETAHEGADINEVMNDLKGMLVAIGYHPHSIESAFANDEFTWFPETTVCGTTE